MNYHCLSLVKLGYQVTMIGYAGINRIGGILKFCKINFCLQKENKQLDQIDSNKNINICPLSPYPKFLQGIF